MVTSRVTRITLVTRYLIGWFNLWTSWTWVLHATFQNNRTGKRKMIMVKHFTLTIDWLRRIQVTVTQTRFCRLVCQGQVSTVVLLALAKRGSDCFLVHAWWSRGCCFPRSWGLHLCQVILHWTSLQCTLHLYTTAQFPLRTCPGSGWRAYKSCVVIGCVGNKCLAGARDCQSEQLFVTRNARIKNFPHQDFPHLLGSTVETADSLNSKSMNHAVKLERALLTAMGVGEWIE